jgi:oligopeptide transport system permease protein
MYIVKRLLMALLTIFVVVTLTFWFMQLVPGGPFTKERMPNTETYANLLANYGLDKPLFVQYLIYLGKAFTFNFGLCMSDKYKGNSVNAVISEGMSYSFPLGLVAAVLAILIGTLLGSIAAVKRGTWIDRVIMVLSTGSVAFPSFVIATILLYWFSIKLGWLPTSSVAAEDFEGGVVMAYILPAITLALYPTAYITRLARSATLDSLGSDYIITARAKGASKTRILFGHVMKNSLAPTITYAGPMFAGIITGSLVIEQIFSIPGVGRPFILAVQARDYSLIMGTTVVMTCLIVLMTLISDLLYKVVNPRVELE